MTPANRRRVLIVGGGPAGLMAGIVLARNDIPTLLIDRKPLPADKVCGEGIMPAGLAVLRELGVMKHLPDDQGNPFLGIKYATASGRTARGIFVEGPGLGMARSRLARGLLKRAREFPNLEIRQETTCELEYSRADGFFHVRLPGGSIQPMLIIGADGLNSMTRAAAGLDKKSKSARRWGARRHYRVRPWNDVVEVYSRPGIEAYITPTGPEETGVAFLWDRERFRPRKGGKFLFESLIAEFPVLAERLKGAKAADEGGAIGPLHRPVKKQIASGLLLLGDAAGYLDAITGEGISLAGEQALSLERTIVPRLREAMSRGAVLRERELGDYQAAYRRITRNYYLVTGLMLKLVRFPRFFDRVVAALHARPKFFAHMLSVNMGSRGLLAVSPMELLRFTGALLGMSSRTTPRISSPGSPGPAGETRTDEDAVKKPARQSPTGI